MIQGIGEPQRRIKWMQFQRGNNGGHGVWCSYAGHENDSADDGINHTSMVLNVNEDMFSCFCFFVVFFCIFNNCVNIKPSHPLLKTEWSAVICRRAGWYQLTEAIKFEMWRVPFFSTSFFSCCCSSLVFLLWWVSTRSKRSLSSDITCQSRQERRSLKVTLLWCLYSVRHYSFHFLWAKIYNLSFDRRSKHL